MMYIWLIIFLFGLSELTLKTEGMFRKHIKKYDVVDCHVYGPRAKRNSHVNNKIQKHPFDAEVSFKSYEIDFHLLLMEDAAFQHVKVESYSKDNSTRSERVKIKIYEGVLKDESLSSNVVGYLWNRVFVGSIAYNETVYFVEPATRFFRNLTHNNKIVVYRDEDIDARDISQDGTTADTNSKKNRFRTLFGIDMREVLPKGINKTENANEEYACAIELVSDYTLYHYFNGNVDHLTAYLYVHGKYSDIIFRRTDFDGDGKRDRIRIITQKIFIYKSAEDPGYTMAKAEDMVSFLKLFALRTQNYCLSVCMSYRYSPKLIIGQAFKSTRSNTGPPGGICQKPIPYSSRFKNLLRSLNTAVVTIQTDRGITLPLAVSLLAVVHELGHSFGSDHDPLGNLYCSPGEPKGFYIMHPKSQMELKPLGSFFSPCSKLSIAGVISARGECLMPHPATCGNGVQEGDEDCDCGKEVSCLFLDKCCTPSDSKPPERGCTFRKSKGSVCSPKENECCLNECAVNQDSDRLCYGGDESCWVSYCDGENATCPKPSKAPDKHICQRTSKSCSRGYCNSSICLDSGLKDCICKYHECSVCCQKADNCVTASSLGLRTSTGEHYFALEGTLCNFKRYQCDGSGKCVNPLRRKLNSSEKTTFLWWGIAGLTFALLVIIIVLGYFAKQFIKKS